MGKKAGKKRGFIDPKKATKFQLLHRSQKDPLIADEQHGERVLHPIGSKQGLEERRKFGIYYTDDYDYFKHLKQVGEAIEVEGAERVESEVLRQENPLNHLPSCIFETKGVELKIGLLNQAAPKNELLPDIDPDIAATLEADDLEPVDADAESGEDELDDIIRMADSDKPMEGGKEWTGGGEMRDEESGKEEMMRRFGLVRRSKQQSDETDDEDEQSGDEQDGEEDAESMAKDDRKSHFTNYSMSSAVIRREDGLRLIDDHFEALYSSQYGEEQEGEGPPEDDEDGDEPSNLIDPNNSARFRALLEEGEQEMQQKFQRELPDPELKQAVLRYAEVKESEEGEEGGGEQMEPIRMPARGAKRGRWDCESIVSMYSNLYNHPTEIREPSRTIGKRKRNNGRLDEKMDIDTEERTSIRSSRVSTASTFRPKGETTEERRQRKQAVKEERRERRQEKKVNRLTFHEQQLAMDAQKQRNAPHVKVRPIH